MTAPGRGEGEERGPGHLPASGCVDSSRVCGQRAGQQGLFSGPSALPMVSPAAPGGPRLPPPPPQENQPDCSVDRLGAAGSPGAGGLSPPGLPLSRAAGWWRSVGFLPPSWSLCEPLRGVGGRPWQAATRGGSAAWGCVHMHVWIVCMHVCVCMCVCGQTCACMCVCMCACMCVHMCVPWGKTVHVCVSACMCVCWQICVCSCVCVHVCMRVCVCRIPADALLCPREEVV